MKVLVYFEQKDNQVISNSLELVNAGKVLGDVTAFAIGEDEKAVQEAAAYGAPIVWVKKKVENQDETIDLIEQEMKEGGYEAVLFPSTLEGKDLAPRLAARCDSCSVTDVVEIREQTFVRPGYGGSVLEQMKFADGKKIFATVRSGSYEKPEAGTAAEVTQRDLTPKAALVKFLEKTVDITEKVDLEGAQVVVAGGRGCKDEETFKLVKELAELLHAEVGASRPVVEAGWTSRAHQVGQSGKTISPKLYIACGISGAMQHICSVTNADYIVAINKDADAPIFDIADVGMVGRCEKIIPMMIEAIKAK
ncbi:MAG: electron transfer flavoprotein subunit alpha/FixB family protein [Eubacterium sp.]|nr:electron transfer flavoprotein subunit alpha/FixB family protein [Eubacterium sp.]